ncbi:protein Ycf2 [Gymnodraco acuticeps]|uniref:Protein Ycf2 n=1 Tax=Gymnodraco acuticeps TaxID=8218 RepID=A0A6P8T6M7_GYMAC|nr:protein Ycf2 [Gymnodraco acuticeps]
MEYCFLKGFLVVLLIRQCTTEDLATSIQSSSVVTLQDDQALLQEPELPPAEVLPVVAPPSLKEVQQAVQEASEQVETHGAEEVLKDLLERVVEAALGQVEGGGEARAEETVVQEVVVEDENEETETEIKAEVLEQAVETEMDGGDMGAEEEDTIGETQDVAGVDALEDEAVEGKAIVEGEGETAVGSDVETIEGGETGRREAEGVEVLNESLDTGVSQEIVEETVAALEETGEYLAVEEAGVEDGEEQVVLAKEKGAAATESEEVEETPDIEEVAGGEEPEQETVEESDPSLVADVEDVWEQEQSQVDVLEGEEIAPPSDDYDIETTQTVVGEPVEEDEDQNNIVKDNQGPEVEDEQVHLVVEEGAAEEVEAEGTEAEGGEIHGESLIIEESVALENEGGDQQAGEEEQIALETSHGSEKEEQEVLVISASELEEGDEATIEQSPEHQAPTPSLSLVWVETGENTLLDEKTNNGNEIITPTEDLLPLDPVEVQPTLGNSVKDVPAEPVQTEMEEPGEANELVEDTAENTETSDLGLDAWKIVAISATTFLVLETVIMIVYILKCRNKNSTPGLQRACEEGCVEPEAATGGDCSDDTLPAGNGDAQQIAPFDPSDVVSTLAQNKEQHEEEHATAMSDLPPRSAEESANTGAGPDSSQDLRTSVL